MRIFPAIDLREGAVVQLVGGDYAEERLRLPRALDVAERFRAEGFPALHVVDLDAATGRGDNRDVVEALLATGLEIQVGGGVRTSEDVARWLDRGAARVVVGTRAVLEPGWLEAAAAAHPGRIVIAADVRGREVLVRGWKESAGLDVGDLLARTKGLPLAAALVTAVHKEGLLGGIDRELYESLVGTLPVFASGGITTLEDLRRLRTIGVAGAVVGTALYTGDLDGREAAKEMES